MTDLLDIAFPHFYITASGSVPDYDLGNGHFRYIYVALDLLLEFLCNSYKLVRHILRMKINSDGSMIFWIITIQPPPTTSSENSSLKSINFLFEKIS